MPLHAKQSNQHRQARPHGCRDRYDNRDCVSRKGKVRIKLAAHADLIADGDGCDDVIEAEIEIGVCQIKHDLVVAGGPAGCDDGGGAVESVNE